VVLLDNRVTSVENVIAQHERRFQVSVVQTWDAASKGYRARIPVKCLDELAADHRVQLVKPWETDEFRKPKSFT